MPNLRLVLLLTAGVTCYYVQPHLQKRRKNLFTVTAKIPEELEHIKVRNYDLLDKLTKYGMPRRDVTIKFRDFEVSYDNQTRVPNYVVERLTADNLGRVDDDVASYERFSADTRATFTSGPFDYIKQEDLVRGQLAYKYNHGQSIDNFRDTYASTAAAPQNIDLNCRVWEQLERYVRHIVFRYSEVYVFTGPIYKSRGDHLKYQVIGINKISVPTHFYKLICAFDKDCPHFSIGCFVIPNEKIPEEKSLSDYQVSFWDLERITLIKFFPPNERPPLENLPNVKHFLQTKGNLKQPRPSFIVRKNCN